MSVCFTENENFLDIQQQIQIRWLKLLVTPAVPFVYCQKSYLWDISVLFQLCLAICFMHSHISTIDCDFFQEKDEKLFV